MKVHQLIDQLREYDPDAPVIATNLDDEFYLESLDLDYDRGWVCIELSEDPNGGS